MNDIGVIMSVRRHMYETTSTYIMLHSALTYKNAFPPFPPSSLPLSASAFVVVAVNHAKTSLFLPHLAHSTPLDYTALTLSLSLATTYCIRKYNREGSYDPTERVDMVEARGVRLERAGVATDTLWSLLIIDNG